MALTIRDVTPADLMCVRDLNEAAVPHVNSLPLEELDRFRGEAAYYRVACQRAEVVGFLVGFATGADYDSVNYRWFEARYSRFIYIDRLAVSERARGSGVARALYADLEMATRDAVERMLCEVNIRPPNEPSAALHRKLGFVEVGRQETSGGAKLVSLLCRDLAAGAAAIRR